MLITEVFMNNTFKKFTASFLAVICLISLFAFSSCSILEKDPALTLNGVKISNDVFAYFLDCATVNSGTDTPYKKLIEEATALTSTYFKTNSLAHKQNISLSTAQKAAVSEKVRAYWNLYGAYYEKIGVSKETLTKVFTADSYKSALMLHYYGEGGENEIPVSRLYAQFRTNYIVFQGITGYFTTTDLNGNTIKISENESEALVLKYQNMAAMINAGEQNMEEAAEFLSQTGIQSAVQTVILHKDDTSYPAGFFNKVQNTEPRIATVIGTTEYIFLILKGDADVNSDYFNEKKPEMIESIVGDEIDVKIENSLTVKSSVSNGEARGYYSLIMNEKGNQK